MTTLTASGADEGRHTSTEGEEAEELSHLLARRDADEQRAARRMERADHEADRHAHHEIGALAGGGEETCALDRGATGTTKKTCVRSIDRNAASASASMLSDAITTRFGPMRSSSRPPTTEPKTPTTICRMPNRPSSVAIGEKRGPCLPFVRSAHNNTI